MTTRCESASLPAGAREPTPEPGEGRGEGELLTDLLILSDGRVLAHNLTPEMAQVLKLLNELPE